jgi:SNF family Na+-dependent transporter
MEQQDVGALKSRDRWGSRTVFVLSCCGALIGVGNVWRFPNLSYEYGGGAFFIPYIIFLLTFGIPLFQAELALGAFFGSTPHP